MKIKIIKNFLPIKNSFSGLDYQKWKLTQVDFYPFYKSDFADNIFKIMLCLQNKPENKELLDTLEQAISFSCSTIISNDKGEFQRVFFESEKDLENFLINYKQEND